jgi:hypothetical protein
MSASSREQFVISVRRRGSSTPAGVGVMVAERHIVTCAHVINTALGRHQRTQEIPEPNVTIEITFPILGNADGAPVRVCRIEKWSPPPQSGLYGGDICCLILVGEGAPADAVPARLVTQSSMRNIRVDLFGYPGDPPRTLTGAWTEHRLRGAVGGGVIQLDPTANQRFGPSPGTADRLRLSRIALATQ